MWFDLKLLKKKKFFILLVLFNFFFTNLISENIEDNFYKHSFCKNSDPNKFINNYLPDEISIETKNSKKWSKNLFELFLELNSEKFKTNNKGWYTFQIDEKYKKKFNSNITFFSKSLNSSCKFKGRVNVRGNLWWHLTWFNGYPFSSMKVELDDGNINNTTKFNLLLPDSRSAYDNDINMEIFISLLFNEIGLLAPKLHIVKVKINGNVYNKYFFQESLEKEFLESRNLVEGPIFEGDTRFTTKNISSGNWRGDLGLARIVNASYANKANVNAELSLKSLSYVNSIFLNSEKDVEKVRCESGVFTIDADRYLDNSYEIYVNQVYESLIIATRSDHSLTCDDRRFYFDPVRKILLPIYNDGKSTLRYNSPDQGIEDLIQQKRLTKNSIEGAKNALDLINKIEDKKFYEELVNHGFSLNFNDYFKIKKKVIENLKQLEKLKIDFLKQKESKIISDFDKVNPIFNNKEVKLVFANLENNYLEICDFKLNTCNQKNLENITKSIYKNLSSQNFLTSEQKLIFDQQNYYMFLSTDKNLKDLDFLNETKLNLKRKEYLNKFNIEYNESASLIVDKFNKKISIELLDNNARVKVTGDKIDNWSFFIDGEKFYKKFKNELKFKKNLDMLTGCLSFIDINIEMINIESNYSLCEDAINFIRSNGTINNIKVNNSLSDSVDFDFSNISINNIEIKNSLNDCIDMSFGKYIIHKAAINTCGDKGISLGEKSKLSLNYADISNSSIGITSKDGSLAEINTANINSNFCLVAYRKKQEFTGGIISYKKLNCSNNLMVFQKGSKIYSTR